MGGVLSRFRCFLGILELFFMRHCYYLYGKFSGFTISMCLRNFGPNILRVWFKLRKFLFFAVIINMNFVLINVSGYSKIHDLLMKFAYETSIGIFYIRYANKCRGDSTITICVPLSTITSSLV